MRVVMILMVLLVASCGRPLTEAEKDFAARLHGDTLDTSRVRLAKTGPVKTYEVTRAVRPRVTCGERIFPPPKTMAVTGAYSAVALFHRVYINPDYYLEDYAPDYPNRLYLYQAMFLAHELTHVWQWQNRKVTGYNPIKAAREHQVSEDPYLFDPDVERDFLEFGYEQQGKIVEEYVCCAVLDPDAEVAPRRKRRAAAASVDATEQHRRKLNVYCKKIMNGVI